MRIFEPKTGFNKHISLLYPLSLRFTLLSVKLNLKILINSMAIRLHYNVAPKLHNILCAMVINLPLRDKRWSRALYF